MLKQRRPFRAIHLETFVKEVHAAVAEKLWKLIVVDADLVQHLKFIRHFFLLGKGEFYRSFIDNSRKMLAAPPQKDLRRSEAVVNLGPWKRAAEMCGLGDMSDDDDNDASGNDYAGLRLRLLSSSFSLDSFAPPVVEDEASLADDAGVPGSPDELVLVGCCLPAPASSPGLSLLSPGRTMAPWPARRLSVGGRRLVPPQASRRSRVRDRLSSTRAPHRASCATSAKMPILSALYVCRAARLQHHAGQPGPGLGFAGIRNSMAVVLKCPASTTRALPSMVSFGALRWKDRCNAHGGGKLCYAPISHIDAHKPSRLGVRYVLEGGEAVGERPKMVLRDPLNGAEALVIPSI